MVQGEVFPARGAHDEDRGGYPAPAQLQGLGQGGHPEVVHLPLDAARQRQGAVTVGVGFDREQQLATIRQPRPDGLQVEAQLIQVDAGFRGVRAHGLHYRMLMKGRARTTTGSSGAPCSPLGKGPFSPVASAGRGA